MRNWTLVSLGIFLVSLGVGWYFFNAAQITLEAFAWILIIAGAAVIVSSLISWRRPTWPTRGLAVALVGGLVLSLFLTAGVGIVRNIASGGIFWPYMTQDTKTFSGPVMVDKIHLKVDNFNGPVRVSTGNQTGYSINLTIKAGGLSQRIAEDNLASLKPALNDTATVGVQTLILTYNIGPSNRSLYSIEVDAALPSSASLDLDLDSSNGGIYLANINGTTVKLKTSNGALSLGKVYVKDLTGITTNGRIEGTIETVNTVLTTSNGRISLTIPSVITGNYDLTTSNGAVELQVSSSPQVGYRLDLSTSNSNININLPNLDYSVNQNTAKKAQTTGFSSKTVQLTIRAITSNGKIDINKS